MHAFSVWAPRAHELAVQVDNRRVPMRGPDEHGWWRVQVESAGAGCDYGFLLDHDPKVYPDPRSMWQPRGVHDLSRVYDHGSFSWNATGFQAPPLESAIVYELHVGTFTREGTLDAAIARLDHLKQLGVTHVELMPVASFSGRHGWGYDGVALFAVHEPYGGPDALKRFVDAAHRHGLAVLLDVVYNHFGPVGNYTGKFAPYVTEAHRTPWGGAVNLEEAHAYEVRRFFCDNALMWMRDFRVDGLRLDAVHAFVDRSAIHFLEQLAVETKALEAATGRRLVLIAESDLNDPRIVVAREAGGLGLDAQWSDDFHHSLFTVLARESQGGYYADFGRIAQLAKALQDTFVYDGVYSAYRKRVHGRPAKQLPQSRFLGYIQNHDQVGNRARGERLTEIAGFDRAKIAAAMVLLSPFIPMIFQGEEWASSSPFPFFADHDDPELARLVSEGRKQEFAAFGWDPASIPDPEERETFDSAKLRWEEIAQGRHAEMLAWYRDLIDLRRSVSDLNDSEPGHIRVRWDEDERWVAMDRDSISLACNLGDVVHAHPLPKGAKLVLSSRAGLVFENGSVKIPPDTTVVIRAES
jgi:maltooligosyltrehalose trehalohydrolase